MSHRQAQQINKQKVALAQPTLVDRVPLDLRETTAVPLDLDMFMADGTKERMRIESRTEKTELQTKLALMIRAPLLFYENDLHWKYIQDGKVIL